MKSIIFDTFKSKLIFGRFSLKYLISKGSFGEVYMGTNIIDGKNYALKIEKRSIEDSVLKQECYKLLNLKGPGIPKVITYGVSGKYNILVENLLGKSIADIWYEKNKKLNLKDTCIFAIQAMSLLESIHSKNYLHRDIKPENFLVGNPDDSQLYLIDFGNARKYKSSKTGKHIKFSKNNIVYGPLIFLSKNVLRGIEQTRKDELESLGYVIIFLYIGSLPWSMLKYKNMLEGVLKTREIRKKISIDILCKGMPQEMKTYMNYINNLKYEECPNYEYLRNLFWNVLNNIGENKLLFSWTGRKTAPKLSKSKSKNNSKIKIFNKLLRENSNRKYSALNIKSNLNNDEEDFLNIMNKNIILKLEEKDYEPLTEINMKKNTSITSSNKGKINSENINDNFKIEENNQNNTQEIKKIVLFKKRSNLNLEKIKYKNIMKLQKKKGEIKIAKSENKINLSNYAHKLYNNSKIRNTFNNNINNSKKMEKAFKSKGIRNYIKIGNININKNFNNYEYMTAFKNYQSQALNNNAQNRIINSKNPSFDSGRKDNIKLKYSKEHSYILSSYNPDIFNNNNKPPLKTNLSEYLQKIDKNKIKKINSKNKHSMQKDLIKQENAENKNNDKYFIYQPIFKNKSAFFLNNLPKKNNIKLNFK